MVPKMGLGGDQKRRGLYLNYVVVVYEYMKLNPRVNPSPTHASPQLAPVLGIEYVK